MDVPGHERFVRTMVAGATGIDLYLMVVAADDGVMPQTREHAAVLSALGVETGVVAVTKADLADPERASVEAAELLPGAEIVARVGAHRRRAWTRCAPRWSGGRARGGRAGGRPAAAARRPRVQHPRRRHRGHGHAVVGRSRCAGANVTVLPSGVRARIRAVEVHDARSSAPRPASASR